MMKKTSERQVRLTLTKAGFEVVEAEDGEKAIKEIRSGSRPPRPAGDEAETDRAGPPPSTRHSSPPTIRTTPTARTTSPTTPCCASKTGAVLSDPKRFKFEGARALPEDRPGDAPASSATTRRRATTRCGWPNGPTSTIEFGTPQLPNFPLPAGFTDDAQYLAGPDVERSLRAFGVTTSPRASSSASSSSSTSSPRWALAPTSSSSGT